MDPSASLFAFSVGGLFSLSTHALTLTLEPYMHVPQCKAT